MHLAIYNYGVKYIVCPCFKGILKLEYKVKHTRIIFLLAIMTGFDLAKGCHPIA